MKILGICKLVLSINIVKTLWFNIKAFSLPVALKFPVIIRKNVKILEIGNIIIDGTPQRAMMVLGGGRY